MTTLPQSSTGRIDTLDAIRGLAALVVVVNHSYYVLPESWQAAVSLVHRTPLRIFALGKPAVVVFFVLSGFVLALSLISGRAPTYFDFVVRRFFRIYVPFALSIFISVMLVVWIDPHPIAGLNPFFNNEVWSADPTARLVASHLLMLNGQDDITLNNAMWSLVIELRLSLIFPLMLAIALMHKRAATTLALVLSGVAAAIYLYAKWHGFPYTNETTIEGVLLTLYFAHCFAFGILLAINKSAWFGAAAELGQIKRLLLWCFTIAALSQNADLLNTAGATMLIVLTQSSARARAVLSWPVLAWLGRVSFSLYLMHLIVIAAFVHVLHDRLPLIAILGMAIAASFVVAQIFHTAVEMPSQKLGRWLTRAHPRMVTRKGG